MSKASFKVWLDYNAFGRVLKSKDMKEACYQEARQIAARAGKGYKATSYIGLKTAGARVWDNSGKTDNNLLKAVR